MTDDPRRPTPPQNGDSQAQSDPAQKLRLAYLAHQNGQLDAADRLYRDIMAADPANADAWHLLGVLHAQRGNHAEAAQLIGRAVAVNPRNAVAFYNLGNVLRELKR